MNKTMAIPKIEARKPYGRKHKFWIAGNDGYVNELVGYENCKRISKQTKDK